MKHTRILALGLVLLAFSLTSYGQDPQEKPKADQTPRIDKREQIQKQRVKQGVKTGELTKKEARRLGAEQRKIKRDESKAKSDGTVTPAERKKLTREQNRANRDIARKKHNPRTQ